MKANWLDILDKIHEPFNSLSHALGALLGFIGFAVLLYLSDGPLEYLGVTLFGIPLVFLYSMSALYHGLTVRKATRVVLRRLDQIGIYTLIAGTITPIALLVLEGYDRWIMMGLIWVFALIGSVLIVRDPFESSWVPTVIYLSMGWIPIVYFNQLIRGLSTEALVWCVTGGLLYTVGAFVYLLEWPEPSSRSGRFGSHEIWHVFTLLASGAHYVLISFYTL
jgi:hemolysin III